jgi:hypothetical protein
MVREFGLNRRASFTPSPTLPTRGRVQKEYKSTLVVSQ